MKPLFWKIAVMGALPLLLLTIVVRQNSWRPRTIAPQAPVARLTLGSGFSKTRIALDAKNLSPAFSPDGQTLRIGLLPPNQSNALPYQIQLWSLSPRELKRTLSDTTTTGHFQFSQLALSNDGQKLAIISPAGELKLQSAETSQSASTLLAASTKMRYSTALVFSPDGTTLAQARMDYGARHNQILLWNARTGQLERALDTGKMIAYNLMFSPDGKTLVANDLSKSVRAWDVKAGLPLYQLSIYYKSPVMSADGKQLALFQSDGNIAFYNARTGKARRKLYVVPKLRRNGQADRRLEQFVFAPNGKTMAVLNRLDPGILGHVKWTTPNATKLIPPNPTPDSVVTLWDAQSGAFIRTLTEGSQAIDAIAFSPDGQTLVAANEGELTLWNPRTGVPSRRVKRSPALVSSLIFAPDGSTLAVVDRTGKIVFWRLK